jgi:hypothetical protein
LLKARAEKESATVEAQEAQPAPAEPVVGAQ